MDGGDVARVRREVTSGLIEHVGATDARLAGPDDPLAKLRRVILRGLRG